MLLLLVICCKDLYAFMICCGFVNLVAKTMRFIATNATNAIINIEEKVGLRRGGCQMDKTTEIAFLCTRLKELREKNKFTMEDMAKKLAAFDNGVVPNKSSISRVEAGKTGENTLLEMAEKYCKVFGMNDEQIEQFTEYYRTPETPETSMNTARVPVETILRAMDAASMYYDDINSSEGHLVFHTEGAPVSFGSWKEVHEWLEGVTFDDPNVSDRVEEILHPERFINIYYDKAVSTDMDVQKRDADELY